MKTKQSVVSSQLKEVEYDTETSLLTVTFMQGRRYEYKDVPADVFRGLIEADSIGSYFINHIKNKYQFKQI